MGSADPFPTVSTGILMPFWRKIELSASARSWESFMLNSALPRASVCPMRSGISELNHRRTAAFEGSLALTWAAEMGKPIRRKRLKNVAFMETSVALGQPQDQQLRNARKAKWVRGN